MPWRRQRSADYIYHNYIYNIQIYIYIYVYIHHISSISHVFFPNADRRGSEGAAPACPAATQHGAARFDTLGTHLGLEIWRRVMVKRWFYQGKWWFYQGKWKCPTKMICIYWGNQGWYWLMTSRRDVTGMIPAPMISSGRKTLRFGGGGSPQSLQQDLNILSTYSLALLCPLFWCPKSVCFRLFQTCPLACCFLHLHWFWTGKCNMCLAPF